MQAVLDHGSRVRFADETLPGPTLPPIHRCGGYGGSVVMKGAEFVLAQGRDERG